MVWDSILFPLPVFVSGVLAATLCGLFWSRRHRTGTMELLVCFVGQTAWMLSQGLLVTSGALSWKLFWYSVTVTGMFFVGTAWLAFGLAYTGHDEILTKRRLAVLVAVPVVVLPVVFTNPRDLFLVDPRIAAGELRYGWGPLAWPVFAYLFSLQVGGTGYLVTRFVHSKNHYRRSSFIFVVFSVVGLVCYTLSVFGVSPLPHFTLWPSSFLVLGVVAILVLVSPHVIYYIPLERIFSVLGSRYEDVVPVARNVVVEELGSGVVVLDSKNRIVDINPMGRGMLGVPEQRVVGKKLDDVVDRDLFLSDNLGFLDPDVQQGSFDSVWVLSADGERRCYDIVVTDLSATRNDVSGRIGLINDVTEQQERKRELETRTEELERQNDRLDDFASIVSHDLRNPLNTAQGFVDMAEETGDPQYFEEIRWSHDRMEEIIEDVLTIARQGQTVTDREPTDVAGLAMDAWNTVETYDATLEIDVDRTIEADPNRLLRLFENLFRNALDHGREDVTVRVGTLDDGFYVADDGPGIPPEDREAVLEEGYTTSEDGTGFGLSIVTTVAEAHGWDVTVTEGMSGGARFDVTGVAATDRPTVDV